jgi:hypothetical protein
LQFLVASAQNLVSMKHHRQERGAEMAGGSLAHAAAVQNFSADDFTAAMLAGVAYEGQSRIPIGHPRVEDGFRSIVDMLRKAAVQTYKQGRSDFAHEILAVLQELRPDPNTGILEGFWASLRRQQPGRASVPNPSYDFLAIRVAPSGARARLDSIPADWQKLVDKAVKILMKEIAS